MRFCINTQSKVSSNMEKKMRLNCDATLIMSNPENNLVDPNWPFWPTFNGSKSSDGGMCTFEKKSKAKMTTTRKIYNLIWAPQSFLTEKKRSIKNLLERLAL